MIGQFLVALVIATVASAKLFHEDPSHQNYLWEQFKLQYNKNYANGDEDKLRLGYFLENLKIADTRNAEELKNGGSAVHGITKFFDLNGAEFAAHYLKSDVSMKTNDVNVVKFDRPVDATLGLVDWSGKLTTPVKDQGYCGSCWAFSATEQIESDAMRTLGVSYVLSPEQITQCDSTSSGCNGGWTEHAYNYVTRAGGIETNAAYPYTSYQGVTGSCKSSSSQFVVGVTKYSTLSSESSMASYVQSTGPLSVCLDASNWNSYHGGIMSVCGQSVDHCVQAVGVDASSSGYWKVRNSWGTSWGESGYIRLAYGKNTCAIANDPTYVTVFKK